MAARAATDVGRALQIPPPNARKVDRAGGFYVACVVLVAATSACDVVSGLSDFSVGDGGRGGAAAAGGGVGGAGASGGGGEAGAGGTLPPLVDDALLVRYFLDDQPPGPSAAGVVADGGPSAVELTLEPDANMEWKEVDGNRGLGWQAAGADGSARRALDETPVSQLDGSTAATIEVVLGPIFGSDLSRIMHVGSDTATMSLVFGPELHLRIGPSNDASISWAETGFLERTVLHLVIHLDDQPPAQLYLDGAPVGVESVDQVQTALDLGSSSDLMIGNRPSGERSPSGWIGYVAIYGKAFAPDEVATNYARLRLSDDR